jgi:hypothetical protein
MNPDQDPQHLKWWCRKREEKEKEVERLLLDKENQVLEARIKLSNAEQNKFNLGQSQSRLGMMIARERTLNTGGHLVEYRIRLTLILDWGRGPLCVLGSFEWLVIKDLKFLKNNNNNNTRRKKFILYYVIDCCVALRESCFFYDLWLLLSWIRVISESEEFFFYYARNLLSFCILTWVKMPSLKSLIITAAAVVNHTCCISVFRFF